jgi:hypothetical protein
MRPQSETVLALTLRLQPHTLALMFARTGRCVVALALCLSVGGHWFCLQSVAWAGMVASYSQHRSLTQAIAQTFDGDHPCDLCKHITKARDTEKKQDRQTSTGKTDLFCTTNQVFLPPPFVPFKYPNLISVSICGSQQPPSPPPRRQDV